MQTKSPNLLNRLGWVVGVWIVCLGLLSTSAKAQDEEAIKPGHVVFMASQIAADMAQLQAHFKVDAVVEAPMEMFQTSPRDVYYQALLLQNKVQILRFEKTGISGARMAGIPESPITSKDSVRVLQDAQSQLTKVMTVLGLKSQPLTGEKNPALSSTRAFHHILQASKQVDPLLEKYPIVPADVIQVVGRTLEMLEVMRERLGEYTPSSPPDPIVGMSAGAVFNGLRRSYVFVRRIRLVSGLPTMALGDIENGDWDTPSSESWMMAQLIYGHVNHLYTQYPSDVLLQGRFFSGPTTSANVYSLVHQLELLTWEFSERVKENPSWLQEARDDASSPIQKETPREAGSPNE